MKIIVCGSRDRSPDSAVVSRLFKRVFYTGDVLIEGGARGADEAAYDWWREIGVYHGVTLHELWIAQSNELTSRHEGKDPRNRNARFTRVGSWLEGKHLGPKRNKAMLYEGAELVIAFPGGDGTDNMVHQARRAGVTVLRVEP